MKTLWQASAKWVSNYTTTIREWFCLSRIYESRTEWQIKRDYYSPESGPSLPINFWMRQRCLAPLIMLLVLEFKAEQKSPDKNMMYLYALSCCTWLMVVGSIQQRQSQPSNTIYDKLPAFRTTQGYPFQTCILYKANDFLGTTINRTCQTMLATRQGSHQSCMML